MADTPPQPPQPPRGGFDPNTGQPLNVPPPAAAATPPPPAPGGFTPPPPAPGGFPPPAPQPPAGGFQPPAPGMGATPPPPTFVPTQTGGYVAPPAGESKSSNGCLKAFLIVGGIVAVLVVIGVVLLVGGVLSFSKAVSDTYTDNYGEAPSSAYELTKGACESSSSGATFEGKLKNTSDKSRAFQLDVSFSSADGVKLGTDSFVSTPSLSPDETGTWNATSYSITTGEKVTCKVDKVSFYGN